MNQVQNISFHGQTVPVFSHNNQHYVAMKPIVENIGLDWVSQYKKIQRSEILKSGMVMMTIPATDGKTYETACLPLDYLNGWLFGVDARRVKPEIRSRLLTYQRECFRVLNEHFNKHPTADNPLPSRAELLEVVRMLGDRLKEIHNWHEPACRDYILGILKKPLQNATYAEIVDLIRTLHHRTTGLDGRPIVAGANVPLNIFGDGESTPQQANSLPYALFALQKRPRTDTRDDQTYREELARRYESDIARLLLYYGEATDRKNEWAQRVKCDALMQTAHLTRVLNEVWNNFIHDKENQSLSDYDFKQAILELNRLHCTISDAANGW